MECVFDQPVLLSTPCLPGDARWSRVRCPGSPGGAFRPPGAPCATPHPLYGAHSAGEELWVPLGSLDFTPSPAGSTHVKDAEGLV